MIRPYRFTIAVSLCLAGFAASAQDRPSLLSDEERSRLVDLVTSWFRDAQPERPDPKLLDAVEREFTRSPSLFTLLDYGLLLEGGRARIREVQPSRLRTWSDARFTAMRRQLERYTVTRPVSRDSLPRNEWWPEAAKGEPAIFPTSKRQAAYLTAPTPSLFKSDVDVFALSAVPEMARQRRRIGAEEGFRYQTPFDPPVQFPSAAPLLARLAPLVEMFKVEGAGTLEVEFAPPERIQFVIDEWSAVVDIGAATLVAQGGRWPVYAMTHGGVIAGRLTRVVARGSECGDNDEYNAVVTFDRPLPKSTYALLRTTARIDATKARITTARALTFFARPGYDAGLWYADLDGDGRQDVAVTIGGESWRGTDHFWSRIYGNVNGRWKELAASSRPSSCT